jgi:hypothetical protein
MLNKILFLVTIACTSLIFFYSLVFAENDMYLRITEVKGSSALVSPDGNRSYKIKIRFLPLPPKKSAGNKNDAVLPRDYPAFMNLATQICHALPGALNVDADKENKSIIVLFSASSREEWIASMVGEFTKKFKEQRKIDIVSWDIDRNQVPP